MCIRDRYLLTRLATYVYLPAASQELLASKLQAFGIFCGSYALAEIIFFLFMKSFGKYSWVFRDLIIVTGGILFQLLVLDYPDPKQISTNTSKVVAIIQYLIIERLCIYFATMKFVSRTGFRIIYSIGVIIPPILKIASIEGMSSGEMVWIYCNPLIILLVMTLAKGWSSSELRRLNRVQKSRFERELNNSQKVIYDMETPLFIVDDSFNIIFMNKSFSKTFLSDNFRHVTLQSINHELPIYLRDIKLSPNLERMFDELTGTVEILSQFNHWPFGRVEKLANGIQLFKLLRNCLKVMNTSEFVLHRNVLEEFSVEAIGEYADPSLPKFKVWIASTKHNDKNAVICRIENVFDQLKQETEIENLNISLDIARESQGSIKRYLDIISVRIRDLFANNNIPKQVLEDHIRPLSYSLSMLKLYNLHQLFYGKYLSKSLKAKASEISIHSLLKELTEIFAYFHKQHGNEFSLNIQREVPPVVFLDSEMLSTIIFIMVTQTLRTLRGTKIELNVYIDEGGAIRFTLSSIAQTKQRNMFGNAFQKFYIGDLINQMWEQIELRELILCKELLHHLDTSAILDLSRPSTRRRKDKVVSSSFTIDPSKVRVEAEEGDFTMEMHTETKEVNRIPLKFPKQINK
eukprot:TRINITY_DN10254_c0_g2_i2.p1 TRINITY_DN10254_c0_g2~~TRINITY_DN10254_c0_g2_i2.p1  ORF type:complete len:632 (-),score=60.17 TRINITY_DN10254_c0_g2_i2:164-2059(-)